MSIAAASPFRFSHTVGMQIQQGRGFHNPMDMAIGKNGVWYVINRSNAMWAPNSLRIGMCTVDEQFLGDFGYFGEDDGRFIWPIGIAADSNGRIYISDEHRHDIQVFEPDGTYVTRFGSFGSGPGQFNRPSSMAFDEQDRLFIADWKNDRVQRLTRDGEWLQTFGTPGTETGQLTRPAGVGVDRRRYVFLADWGNERVQVFRPDGSHLLTLIGDATLSTWAQDLLADRPDLVEQRALVEDMDVEKRFWGPTAVKIDAEGRILMVDSCRYRVQVYEWAEPA